MERWAWQGSSVSTRICSEKQRPHGLNCECQGALCTQRSTQVLGGGRSDPLGNKALTSQQMADGSQLSALGSPLSQGHKPSQGCRHPVTSEVDINAQLPLLNSRACGSPIHRTRPHVFPRIASTPESFRLRPQVRLRKLSVPPRVCILGTSPANERLGLTGEAGYAGAIRTHTQP